MTTDKDFKRLVRGRMRKTGESYTAARAQLLKQGSRRTAASVPSDLIQPAPAQPAPTTSTAKAPKATAKATTANATTANATTANATTANATTAKATTAKVTTAKVTTAKVTTAKVTAAKATTAKATTAKATTAKATTPRATRPKPTTVKAKSPKRASATVETEYAHLAGRSDAAVKAATGCTWARWVKALDHAGAHEWPHTRIARYVHETYKVPGWWAQGVTVGYERIKGLRAIGQRRDGQYEINRSKTVAAPLARLYDAFHEPELRARWLPGVPLTVRSATDGKWMRITWPDGTSVSVGFTAKGDGKSQVALTHEKLPDAGVAAERRQYWGERLEALSGLLAG